MAIVCSAAFSAEKVVTPPGIHYVESLDIRGDQVLVSGSDELGYPFQRIYQWDPISHCLKNPVTTIMPKDYFGREWMYGGVRFGADAEHVFAAWYSVGYDYNNHESIEALCSADLQGRVSEIGPRYQGYWVGCHSDWMHEGGGTEDIGIAISHGLNGNSSYWIADSSQYNPRQLTTGGGTSWQAVVGPNGQKYLINDFADLSIWDGTQFQYLRTLPRLLNDGLTVLQGHIDGQFEKIVLMAWGYDENGQYIQREYWVHDLTSGQSRKMNLTAVINDHWADNVVVSKEYGIFAVRMGYFKGNIVWEPNIYGLQAIKPNAP